ncbi:MAG: hypothetical protein WC609_03685 [Candidatus Paceibacterota bacterium]
MFKIKNKNDRSMAILFSLFIVSIMAVILYVSWSFDSIKPEADNKGDVKKELEENLTSDTAGWKVYYNNDYGFRIDYPGDWNIQVTKYEDLSTHSVYFGKPVNGYYPVMINFYKKPSDIPLNDWVEKNTYFSGTFQKGFVESKGMPSNYYIDKATMGGMEAYKVTLLSDTYFFPKVFKGKLDDYYSRCKCDYDTESIYLLKGNAIIGITHINNMNGKKTSNNLVEKEGKYEVESSDKSYLENKDMFSGMLSSFRFAQ